MNALLVVALLSLSAEPELELPGPIVFLPGSAKLNSESNHVLDAVKTLLDATPAIALLRVEVHTDSRGNDAFNQKLTEDRAAAVVAELVKRGVARERLLGVGFGESRPIAPNDTNEGRARNRRTVFVKVAAGEK